MRQKTKLEHGVGGYRNHGCRCPVCVSGNRDYTVKWRRSTEEERAAIGFPHGVIGYAHGCRCSFCKEKMSSKMKLVCIKHQVKIRERHWRKYGIKMGGKPFLYQDYVSMHEKADGKCEICGRILVTKSGEDNTASVDHNHQTGEVRGLLCQSCNFMIAHSRDCVETLVSGSEYLKNR